MITNKFGLSMLAITGAFLFLNACNSGNTSNKSVINQDDANVISKAICVITPSEGNNVKGIVSFTQQDSGILVIADIEGLSVGEHGFHIHEFGDISKLDGTSAGGHFNPEHAEHSGPGDTKRHVGDLGNITADENGKAHYERLDNGISFSGKHNIIGRAIIIHTGEDDFVTQPTGDAGARVAYGVIGIGK